MEMNNFRGESHVAQQSRRDKLRVHQQPSSEHLENHYTNNLEQLSVHHGLNPDLIQLSYDHPPVFSSEMLNYATKNSQVLLPQNNSLASADNVTIAKVSGDPHNCSNCDWNVNTYFGNATSIHESNTNPMLPGEGGGSDSLKVNSNFASSLSMRQLHSYGYQDVANPLGETSIIHQNSQKHFGEMPQCSSSSFNYQNALTGVVTSATIGNQGLDMVRFGKDSNELVFLPSFADHQSNRIHASNTLVDRPVEAFRHWDGEGLANKIVRDRMRITGDSSNTQGLSLSLSSVPLSKTYEGQFGDPLDSKASRSNYLGSSSRQSVGSKIFGYNHQDIQNAAGPLGPFTGYTTILKNSKYLKPTLQLLDELYGITGSKQIKTCETYSDEISEQFGVSCDAVNVAMVEAKVSDSGTSSSTFYSFNEINGEPGGRSSSSKYCYGPEYHQKKANLLYMQEEVCRSYKQYHQQMQMVVSSFESVAGLSAATPYISMALKTVLRHFRCLKNAISDQLRHMGKAVTGDLPSPTAGTRSNRKADASNSPLKFSDHGFQKQNSGGSNLIFFEPQLPIWRPQRGLPERAVAVLRAWLFDHFLHPYPTDTDKHMLATQTGLTRNQVSNWFINARVRIWKPMVEEIHVLETKGLAEPSLQTGKAHENPAFENAGHQYENQQTNNFSGMHSSRSNDGLSAEFWNQEKQSRVECQIPGTMDQGSLMSFLPYQHGGLEIGTGLGAVSLTLGLRQSAESAQLLQQQQQEHYRQHFDGQMIHDFVG